MMVADMVREQANKARMTTGDTHRATPARVRVGGWTLIELLVVLAIITILGALSVPVTRMFSRNDLRDGARTIYTMLRAARVYAMTYNVETAVVYALDDEFTQNGPIEDTLRGGYVRAIRAAAVMYRLPDEFNIRPYPPDAIAEGDPSFPNGDDALAEDVRWQGTYVPVPRTGGEFVFLPRGYALLLEPPRAEYMFDAESPEEASQGAAYPFDVSLLGRPDPERYYLLHYNRQMDFGTGADYGPPRLNVLGMMPVHVYYGVIDRVLRPYVHGQNSYVNEYQRDLVRPHMAHVFTPRGSLKVRDGVAEERFRLLVAYDPWQNEGDRLIEYPDSSSASGYRYRLVNVPIEIHRATGRARMGS